MVVDMTFVPKTKAELPRGVAPAAASFLMQCYMATTRELEEVYGSVSADYAVSAHISGIFDTTGMFKVELDMGILKWGFRKKIKTPNSTQ